MLIMAILAVMALSGCNVLQPPAVQVQDVAQIETTSDGTVLNFRLAMGNPNSESLQLLEVSYELIVDGQVVYEGRRAAQRTLGPRTEAEMELPAVIPFARIGWGEESLPRGAPYHLRGTLQYVTPGYIAEILFDTGVRRPRIAFADQGEITLDR